MPQATPKTRSVRTTSRPTHAAMPSKTHGLTAFLTAAALPPPPRARTVCHAGRRGLAVAAAVAVVLSRAGGASGVLLEEPAPPVAAAAAAVATAERNAGVHAAVAVVGVGRTSIQDYSVGGTVAVAPEAAVRSAAEVEAEDAKREIELAARLLTAVLLGVLVGMERRATALQLGVRSVTITSLSAALVACMAGAPPAAGAAVSAVPSLVPAFAALAGLGLFAAGLAGAKRPKHALQMSAVVCLAVAMGSACGAALPLVAGCCYLAAVGVLRMGVPSRRPLSRRGADGKTMMVLRIAGGPTGTRVVEVAGNSLDDAISKLKRVESTRNGAQEP